MTFERLAHGTLVFLGLTLAGWLAGSLAGKDPEAAIVVAGGAMLVGFLLEKPLAVACLLVAMTPFAGTALMRENVLPVPGGKPLQLFAVFAVAVALWNQERARRIPRKVACCAAIFLGLFTICVLRTIPQLEEFAIEYVGTSTSRIATPKSFVLTDFVKPLVFMLPFFLIPLYCRTVDDIETVVRYLVASAVALSVFLLSIYLYHGADASSMTAAVGKITQLHRNEIGSLLLVAFPFLIANYFIRSTPGNLLAIALCIAATGILFSRTAYVTLALTPLLYLLMSKRTWILPAVVFLALLLVLVAPQSILERASHGFDSASLDEVAAGRLDHMWLPVMDEFLDDPQSLLFGRGRYGLLSTEAARLGILIDAKHPHNLYLELLVETGLTGLVFSLLFVTLVLFPMKQALGQTKDVRLREYSFAVVVSVACYLIAGIVGRSLFPKLENAFFWVSMAMAVVIPALACAESEEEALENIRFRQMETVQQHSCGERGLSGP